MNKFYLEALVDNQAVLNPDDQHHVCSVLRLQPKAQLIGIFAGQKYVCEISSILPFKLTVIETLVEDTTNPFELNVFLASIKPAHMELAVIKACELNVDHFYIFNAQWSQGNIKHNLERYQKLIKAACQQANRNKLMELRVLTKQCELTDLLAENDVNLIGDFTPSSTDLKTLLETSSTHRIGIIIGPEAGFSETDINFLKVKNSHIINLTKTILRAETAMLYLVSIVSALKLRRI